MEQCNTVDTNKTRLGIQARWFWIQRQKASLDVRLFDSNACWPSNSSLTKGYVTNNKEKDVTTTNAPCKLSKEILSPWYFQFMVVWVKSAEPSTQD